MNGVIGMAELLLDTELSDTQRFYADTVKTCGRSLLKIVNDILDFSKVEAGKLELEHIAFDLRELFDDLVSMIGARADEKGIELSCNIHPDVHSRVVGDSGRLRQILLNLVGNSLKFTDTGKISVSVVNASKTGSQTNLRFIVRDTGIGIPLDKQELLFNSFTQVDSSNTRMFGGTGLGLAICRQLVQLMGGEIGVRSEEGKGCEFWFTVDLGNQQIEDTFPSDRLIPSSERASFGEQNLGGQAIHDVHKARGGVRLLLVEDNQINQQVVCGILGKLGIHNVDVAEHGVAALQALDKLRVTGKRYDLILMDIQMPVMDGIEATKRIRRIETKQKSDADIPIIALTAHALKSDFDRCIKAGMNDFLTKPILPERLEKVLQEWLVVPAGSVAELTDAQPAAKRDYRAESQPREQAVTAGHTDFEPDEGSWESSPVFDYPALKRRLGDDRGAMEIIEVYWSRLPGQLEELKGLIATGRQTEVLQFVHNLKGSSGSVGAMQLFELFKVLERAVKRDKPLHELLAIIDRQAQEFGAALRLYLS